MCLIFVQTCNLARDHQLFIPTQRDAMFGGKTFRAFSNKIHMRTLTENLPRRAHGIAQPLDAAHAPGAQRRSIHDERVELYLAVAIEKTPPPGVESLVILHDDDRFLNRVERRSCALQHAPSRSQRIAHAVDVGLDHVIGYGPRASVDDEYRIGWHRALV